MHGVKAAAVHSLQNDDVPAGVGDATRDREVRLSGLVDGGRHHLLGTVIGQALVVGDIHGGSLASGRGKCAPGNVRHQVGGQKSGFIGHVRRATGSECESSYSPKAEPPWPRYEPTPRGLAARYICLHDRRGISGDQTSPWIVAVSNGEGARLSQLAERFRLGTTGPPP